jgi:hypothetical protein
MVVGGIISTVGGTWKVYLAGRVLREPKVGKSQLTVMQSLASETPWRSCARLFSSQRLLTHNIELVSLQSTTHCGT